MARISEKALRPRQYVFNRLSAERIARLTSGVRKLRESEKRQSVNARAATRAADRHVAARHAENIMAGLRQAVPESDEIGVLEKELEELRRRKRDLFDMLRKSLGADSHAIAHGDVSGDVSGDVRGDVSGDMSEDVVRRTVGASSLRLAASEGLPNDLVHASAEQSASTGDGNGKGAKETTARTE